MTAIFNNDSKEERSMSANACCRTCTYSSAKRWQKEIAAKIGPQIPFDTILDSIPGSVESIQDWTENMLTSKDLCNITKDYSLGSEFIHHAFNVKAWVDQMCESESNGILLYKRIGVESPNYPELK